MYTLYESWDRGSVSREKMFGSNKKGRSDLARTTGKKRKICLSENLLYAVLYDRGGHKGRVFEVETSLSPSPRQGIFMEKIFYSTFINFSIKFIGITPL